MLKSTFLFLKGIGPFWESRLWEADIRTWDQFLSCDHPPGISSNRKRLYNDHIREAQSKLQSRQSVYFGKHLRKRDHWRLFDTFKTNALYLDIETTGGSLEHGEITVVGLYRRGNMTTLVQGDTLCEERLNAEFSQSEILVTFFGSVFDIPFLQKNYPGLLCNQPHFDLCFAARRLGIRGGLKAIEQHVGLSRPPDLFGLDGWAAVQLWNDWLEGRKESLQTLLRYNESDTKNLEPLAELLHSKLTSQFGPPPISMDNHLIAAHSNVSG